MLALTSGKVEVRCVGEASWFMASSPLPHRVASLQPIQSQDTAIVILLRGLSIYRLGWLP
jgi:hypothetical protein